MAAAKKKTAPPPDDFDAHQFQIMHEAANQLPRTARGGVRDLFDKDEPDGASAVEYASLPDRVVPAHPPVVSRPYPTLAETQERRRFVSGEVPAMDTIYREPEAAKPRPAAVDKAHVRHGSDVHFKEDEPVVPAATQEEPEEDPRARFIDALNGSGPPKGELPVARPQEDPRFTVKNGYRFYNA